MTDSSRSRVKDAFTYCDHSRTQSRLRSTSVGRLKKWRHRALLRKLDSTSRFGVRRRYGLFGVRRSELRSEQLRHLRQRVHGRKDLLQRKLCVLWRFRSVRHCVFVRLGKSAVMVCCGYTVDTRGRRYLHALPRRRCGAEPT